MPAMREWHSEADRLAAEGRARGEAPTAWFEKLYRAAAEGTTSMPWDREAPNVALAGWLDGRTAPDGATAVQVGCGLGTDAEHLASLGWRTTAFDVSPTAVSVARDRHPDSSVDYVVADLFDLPADWRFDLVVEIFTVQALPLSSRAAATAAVRSLVAPGGTLVVVQLVRSEDETDPAGPPWPLSRSEVEAFAGEGLELVELEEVARPEIGPDAGLWCAELRRAQA